MKTFESRFVVLVSFCLILMCSAAMADPPAGSNWQLVWSDEFNSSETPIAPDPGNWGYENGYVRNREEQYYTNSLQNAYCQNGYLNIEAHKHPPGTYPTGGEPGQDGSISSTSIRSMGKVSYQFGYFEIRARIDTQLGSWPAFWTLGNSGEWPDGGECDILEYYTGKFLFNVAWWKTGDPRWVARWDGENVYLSSLPAGWLDEFHIWSMEWDTNEVKLYLDGALINTWDASQDNNGGGDTSVEGFQQPHYMLINQAIGGTAGGDTSGMVFPTTYEVDWVRIWQLNNSAYCGDSVCSGAEDLCNCPDDCSTPPATETVCDDGLDDDCDGVTDCEDSDCNGDLACLPPTCGDSTCASGEDQCNCPGDCGTPPVTETTCNDGMDEDCDGYFDCDDSDCDSDPACYWTKIDDRDPMVSYDASWGEWNGNPGYLGTETFCETVDGVATFNFTGIQARYYGFKRNDLGYADIYVDSVYDSTIDCYASSGQYDLLLYETAVLPYGPHTIEVVVNGGSNASSNGFEIIVDAFEYADSGGGFCGDSICGAGEDQCNCSSDCGTPPATETTCTDGIDEDCDGNTDCADPDCDSDPACYVPACGTGICDPGEDQCNCPSDCGTPPSIETACTDGIDEDCDGSTDCGDPDCDSDPACYVPACGTGICDAGEDQCNCPSDCGTPPATETDCTDGFDEDCDGNTDCFDLDCDSDPACQCGNGVCDPGEDCLSCSADCIGRTSGKRSNRYCCGDGTCEGAEDETNCAIDCGGGGSTCGDSICDPGEDQCNCAADCGTPPSTETSCTDGIDEDCDGNTDCGDSDCDLDPACDCLPKKALCSDNTECCSNKCRSGKCR